MARPRSALFACVVVSMGAVCGMGRIVGRVKAAVAGAVTGWKSFGVHSGSGLFGLAAPVIPDHAKAELCAALKKAVSSADHARHMGNLPFEAMVLFDRLSDDARDVAPAFSQAARGVAATMSQHGTGTGADWPGARLRMRYYRSAVELSCHNAGCSVDDRPDPLSV